MTHLLLGLDRVIQFITRVYRWRGRGRFVSLVDRLGPRITVDEVHVAGVRWKMVCDKGQLIQRHIHYFGVWELDETLLLSRLLRPDSVFFDVGANVGWFTLLAAKLAPRGQVFAFEPVAATRDVLERNIRLNDLPNVKVVHAALAECGGSRMMYYSPWNDCGSTSLGRYDTDRGGEKVECLTLDDFVTTVGSVPHIIKVDVEGAEPLVLQGGRMTLSGENAPDLILEVNRGRLAALGFSESNLMRCLYGLGYRVYTVGPRGSLLQEPTKRELFSAFATKKVVPRP